MVIAASPLAVHAQLSLFLGDCRVAAHGHPDRAHLERAAAERQASRATARRIEEARLAEIAAAERRAAAPPAQPSLAVGAAITSGGSQEITYQHRGKTYTARVAGTQPRDDAIAMLRKLHDEEDRIGPEKNRLLLAVGAMDAEAARTALRQGSDPNQAVDKYGRRIGVVAHAISAWYAPGHEKPVAQKNSEAARAIGLVKVLVEGGADPSLPASPGGATALGLLIGGIGRMPHPDRAEELAAYLLERGAVLREPRDRLPSDLELALDRNLHMLGMLLRLGKPTQTHKDAALKHAVALANLSAAAQLVEAGANPAVAPQLLGQVIRARSWPLWHALKRHAPDLNAPLMGGKPPLLAVIHDHDWMQELLDHGANPNATSGDPGGNPPVHSALHAATSRNPFLAHWYGAQMFDPEVRARSVELLLRRGAEPNLRNGDGWTPLMQTLPEDGRAIQLLIAAGASVVPPPMPEGAPPLGPVGWALGSGNETLATALVKTRKSALPEDCGAVYYAARSGASSTLKALVDLGEGKRRIVGPAGESPLIAAAMGGHASSVRLLLEHKAADVDEATRPITLPQLVAGSRGRLQLGRTALMAAAAAGHVDVVALLLAQGADPALRDAHGRNASDHASGERAGDIRAMLQAAGDKRPRR